MGAYAADILLYARHGYPNFPAAARHELALHAFFQGLAPPWLWQHVRLNMPPTLDVALDLAEQAERELSDQPGLQPSTEDDCEDQSGTAKNCCRRCGARVDAAGAALSRGTTTVVSQTRQDKDQVRKPRPLDLEPEQCWRVKDCGRTGQDGFRGFGRGGPIPPAAGDGRDRLRRNWTATGRGRGSGGGHRKISDCVMGVGVVGTSDP